MKEVELGFVGGHVEEYTGTGAFLFSADTLREAMEELDAACRVPGNAGKHRAGVRKY